MLTRREFNLASLGLLAGCGGSSGGEMEYQIQPSPRSRSPLTDSFQEGQWTPTFLFSTPGDLSASPTEEIGLYTKIGRTIIAHWRWVGTATWTTASGGFQVGGLPFKARPGEAGLNYIGTGFIARVTKSPYTSMLPRILNGDSVLSFYTIALEGSSEGFVLASNMTSGQTFHTAGMLIYNS